jgi:uncharacterized protein (TIGR02611 family)
VSAEDGPEPRDGRAREPDTPGLEPGEKRPKTVERLLARRDQHKEHNKLYRVAWATAGFLLIVAGLAIAPLPGPGPLIIVPLGLAMLALEFVWAERLLERALVYGNRAKEQASGLSAGQKATLGAAILVAATALVIAVLYLDIPYLPDR